jgi:FdrA protein
MVYCQTSAVYQTTVTVTMAITTGQVRSGAYYDSVVLMQLQRSLAGLPGILDAGVVMGTVANKEILAQTDLLTLEARAAMADDLVIVVRADDTTAAQAALDQVDTLLTQRRHTLELEFLPKSLESAAQMLPDAQWVLISVAGRYAAGVARQALNLGKHVFLYSDNVSLEDEISLKQLAAGAGLLVMGPDCGTAIVNGVGLGFANRVRRGPIGLVAAAGTGLQQVSSRIHQLGGGLTHALGTGGRDLSETVGAVTARQGLDLLSRDPETQVIVLISKPPAPRVADELLQLAREAGKPVVVDFIGYLGRSVENLHFATSLDEAAALAVRFAADQTSADQTSAVAENLGGLLTTGPFAPGQRYLRGLFSGGTLAYEAQLLLQDYLPGVPIWSNAPLRKEHRLANSLVSQEHSIIDLGEDEFTVGRLHPMVDNDLRVRRLHQEAGDPDVAVILLDVVLGDGAHPDPAGELAPAIARAHATAAEANRHLEIVAIVVGTDGDPQNMSSQMERLQAAGTHVETSNDATIRYVAHLLQSLNPESSRSPSGDKVMQIPSGGQNHADPLQGKKSVDLAVLQAPFAAINAGLESFAASLRAQGAPVVQVDWRPPAGGNEQLMAILERMKRK